MEINNFASAMEYLSSLKRFGAKPGLSRMEILAEKSGLFEKIRRLRFIHIAGTNGKGSAASMCASTLTEAGYRTGLYVSPFVEHFTERIRVDGKRIPEQTFADYVSFFKPYIDELDCEKYGDVKEFELITLVGLKYFADMECDYIVFEVGIGGRLDATNIISPLVCLIMSISFDHTAQLGNTIEKIAFEKCGIIKNSVPVVAYPKNPSDADCVIKAVCACRNSELILPDTPEDIVFGENGTDFIYKGKNYHTALSGIHQAYNAATVLECIFELRKLGADISDEAIEKGFASIDHPARFETLCSSPTVILDGAHNEGAAKALKSSLDKFIPNKKRLFVMGMCKDHITDGVLDAILDGECEVYASAAADIARALSPQELANAVRPYCAKAEAYETLGEALKAAVHAAGDSAAVICFGSLFIAKEIKENLQNAIQ